MYNKNIPYDISKPLLLCLAFIEGQKGSPQKGLSPTASAVKETKISLS